MYRKEMANHCGNIYTECNTKLSLVRQVCAHVVHLCLTKKKKKRNRWKESHHPSRAQACCPTWLWGNTTDTQHGGSCQRTMTLSVELKWHSQKCKRITLFSLICYSCGFFSWRGKERPWLGKQTDLSLTLLFRETNNNWKQSVVNLMRLSGRIRKITTHIC